MPTTPNEREDWEKELQEYGALHDEDCYELIEETCECDMGGMRPFIKSLLTRTRQEEREKVEKLSGALMNMYEQYCTGGHAFMNAGEDASAVLEEYGYATFDGTGRLLEQARNLT